MSDAEKGGWVRGGKMSHGIVFPHRKGNVTVSLRSLRCNIQIKLYFYCNGGTPPAQHLNTTTPPHHPAHHSRTQAPVQEGGRSLNQSGHPI
ncbi:MAG: hypothetical protein K0A89_12680 [ANME-2 cluster archaeon]|nr:hypothetical protein [ANME-2 cluster archaeon]